MICPKSHPSSFIPFSLPEIGDDEVAEVVKVLRSGWVTTGPKAATFESDFADFIGGGVQAIAINSATSGLHLGLEALGIGPGDEVITTVHTFTATAEIIRYLGGHPIFVDIDPDTLCLDVSHIEAAITPRTRAIIPMHFGGLAAPMDEVLAVARRNSLSVMEDAAHALPTSYNGKLIGSLDSDVCVFSFYANKTMTTGEGGMLVTRDPAIAARARVMRLHGISKDAFERYTSKQPSWYYEIVAPGYKYNMTDISAAMGIHQLKRLREFQSKREKIAHFYSEMLADMPLVLPPGPVKGNLHAWHLYVVRMSDDCRISRDKAIERLFAAGIGCSVHYIPLHLQPYWRDTYQLQPEMFPRSQKAYERSISLPIYSCMTEGEAQRVVDAVRRALA
jgi:dTDP-4-amino-4,6-dideoxygalactose transaminase